MDQKALDASLDSKYDINKVSRPDSLDIEQNSAFLKASSAVNDDSSPAGANLPKITIGNFAKVSDGIYRGAAPTESQVQELKALGVRTIIDLRIPDSDFHREEKAANKFGINYYNEPLLYNRPHTEKMAEIMTILNKPENQPVYVHCREGEDRTGTVIGTERRVVSNWDWNSTYSEMLHYGFHPAYKGLANFVKDSPSEPGLPNFKNKPKT